MPGKTIAITANGRNESIVDSETKSVTGYSSNSYTGNVVTESGDTVSTLAASKIMYETPDVIFGQVVDAKGTESAVPNIPFDIKKIPLGRLWLHRGPSSTQQIIWPQPLQAQFPLPPE